MLVVSWGLGLETSVVNTGELGRSQSVLSCDVVAAKAPIAPERALGLERPSKWSQTEASWVGLCIPDMDQALCTGGPGAGQLPYQGDSRGRDDASMCPWQHCRGAPGPK